MNVNEVKSIIEKYDDWWTFGLRADNMDYQIGDVCNISHQLYQDPMYDEDMELIYPYCYDGLYQGFYDGGELDGTCIIEIKHNDDESIQQAIELVNGYFGEYIYLVTGEKREYGLDEGEVLLRPAYIIGKFKKY